ncbi:MAG TPA: hypothetical protein VIH00_07915 [Candidatus Limnocylindrales bacterium]
MFKKILPFVIVAIVLGVALSVLVATQRLGCTPSALGRFVKRLADLPIEPGEPSDPAGANAPERAA